MSDGGRICLQMAVSLIEGKTALDVGCGYGKVAHAIENGFWNLELADSLELDGLDASPPHINYCAAQNHYRNIWHQLMPSPLHDTWDTVLSLGVLEYIDPTDTVHFVSLIENSAKKRVIFSTPSNGEGKLHVDTTQGFHADVPLKFLPQSFFYERGYDILEPGDGTGLSHQPYLDRQNLPCQGQLAKHFIAYKDMELLD